jgi:hypothetical protein
MRRRSQGGWDGLLSIFQKQEARREFFSGNDSLEKNAPGHEST